MDKIKKIEKLLTEWKASKRKAGPIGFTLSGKALIDQTILELNAALAITKRPSNTRMHVDTNSCADLLHKSAKYLYGVHKCKYCGKNFSQGSPSLGGP